MQITLSVENKFVVDYSLFIYEADVFQKCKQEVKTILAQKDTIQLEKLVADLADNLDSPIDFKSKVLYAENTFVGDIDKMIGLYRQRVDNKLNEAKRGNFSLNNADDSYEVTIHILNWYVQKSALVTDLQPLWFTDFRFRLSELFFLSSTLWQEACKVAWQHQLPYSDKYIETDTFLEKFVVFFKSDFLKEVAKNDWNKVDVQRFTDRLVLDYFRNNEKRYLVTTEFY